MCFPYDMQNKTNIVITGSKGELVTVRHQEKVWPEHKMTVR